MAANPILEALKGRLVGNPDAIEEEHHHTRIILKSGKDMGEVLVWGFNADETAVEIREADHRTSLERSSDMVRTALDTANPPKICRRGVVLISEIAAVMRGYEG
jgi:hypothetical protein